MVIEGLLKKVGDLYELTAAGERHCSRTALPGNVCAAIRGLRRFSGGLAAAFCAALAQFSASLGPGRKQRTWNFVR
jgi:hypothetical protein